MKVKHKLLVDCLSKDFIHLAADQLKPSMENLLIKINYKGYERICVQNAGKRFLKSLSRHLKDIRIDEAIDPRFLYEFIIIFANSAQDVDLSAHRAIHNLYDDGILWYVFPKNVSDGDENALTRKKGWNACKSAGFEPVRLISFDDNLSAMRFRNKKYISRRNRK
jgi:hypothetical protein